MSAEESASIWDGERWRAALRVLRGEMQAEAEARAKAEAEARAKAEAEARARAERLRFESERIELVRAVVLEELARWARRGSRIVTRRGRP